MELARIRPVLLAALVVSALVLAMPGTATGTFTRGKGSKRGFRVKPARAR